MVEMIVGSIVDEMEKDIYIVLNEHNIGIFLLIFFLLLRSRYGLIWVVC